ncbi:hypothetical protein CONCODRAFT_168087 [Conidiobolus coronatus NRRL 28638]|uniref:Carbohydrate-binding module family 19 domain-containing protein n=1 Tax=Conidiobolus coronatus (strain ATCC 28846 / CBS 209.66 / NRRL 28638) TaxID=796925 RepID=A0A137NVT4_CONC2|nr:hypothetical protein CONCODRAFT_168087 [Conidiobolus coronatus NRRL 28638]|eukprot:KXN66781.1 hypothetical protein CONCODRAFT_168087 [Conidiobolus coronatus NRRL 28638]
MKFINFTIFTASLSAATTEFQVSNPVTPNNPAISRIISQVDPSAAKSPNGPKLISVTSEGDGLPCMTLETMCSETDPYNWKICNNNQWLEYRCIVPESKCLPVTTVWPRIVICL